MTRGEILSVKEMEYVEAIRALGGKDGRIIIKHIIPNVISPVIIVATLLDFEALLFFQPV